MTQPAPMLMGDTTWPARMARIPVRVAATLALAILASVSVRTLTNAGALSFGGGEPPLFSALWRCSLLGFLVVGAVVAFRRSHNPIGCALTAIPLTFRSNYALAVESTLRAAHGLSLPSWGVALAWLLHGASAPVLLLVAVFILLAYPHGEIDPCGQASAPGLVAEHAGGRVVSVLKYRLWDIDPLVSRSVTYTLVTAILIGIDLGLVVLLQPAVRPVAGDAERMVATFGGQFGSELDLAAVREELLRVVGATLQPSHRGLSTTPPVTLPERFGSIPAV